MLETKRLILRLTQASDLDELYALRSCPDVMFYTSTGVQTKAQVEDWMSYSDAYFEKHGLAFFSVFEKERGALVGQGGLFHVGFDDTQPEIELAYRFKASSWHKGYATEVSTMLIQWGFEKHGFSKIIAFVHPENERSRRVMEKIGMHYVGLVEFKGFKDALTPRYEIINKSLDSKAVQFIPATLEEHYPIMQNMSAYYAYDIGEYIGWKQAPNGSCDIGLDFSKYWKAENTWPFIIKYKGELAGFVIVDKDNTDPGKDFNIVQFFVLRQFKGLGLGKYIAFRCFDEFVGQWEVFVMPGNEGAYRFWRRIIKEYSEDQFTEYTRIVNNCPRNIFSFKSRETI